MASTGSYLRERREQHGVSLEELARATRIGQRFLEALERDEFAVLPAGPFAKGFIRSYCQALNEPPDEPLALYARDVGATETRPVTVPLPPRPKGNLAPVVVSLALLVILGGALAGVTLVLRSGDDGGARPEAPPVVTPGPAHVPGKAAPGPGKAIDAPRAIAAPAPATPGGLQAPAPVPAPERKMPSAATAETPYRLVARASDPTWIRVRMEGGRTIEETIPAGEVREWVSNHPFELRIGNAGGLTLELNGQVLPSLGARGAVITRLVLPAESQ
jgi:cytoskeleton protein RodZ